MRNAMDMMPLDQLDDQALLLAYLAGELPAEHRTRVEQRLAADARLSAMYEEFRAAYTHVQTALHDVDAQEPLVFPASAAARRFGRQVRAWHAGKVAAAESAAVETAADRRFRVPGWAYPVATAAAVVLAYSAWWRFAPDRGQLAINDRPPTFSPMPTNMLYSPFVPPTAVAEDYAPDIGAWTTPNALADREDMNTELALAETEAEVYALSDPALDGGDADDDVPTMLLLDELE